MKKILLGALLSLFGILEVGCVSSATHYSTGEQAQYEQNRRESMAVYFNQMYLPECPPSGDYQPQCPPLLSLEQKKESNAVISRCSRSKNRASMCGTELSEMIGKHVAQLMMRYKFADWERIQLECQADKALCTDPLRLELRALSSHNQTLGQLAKKANLEIGIAYAQKIKDRMAEERLLEAMRQIAVNIKNAN